MRAGLLAAFLTLRAFGQTGNDAVSDLNERVRAGGVQLQFDDSHGYLKAVLDALHVPVESQLLVFSKTSGQAMRIEPRYPRALYFNDTVTVGWVRGGLLEVMAQNPRGEMTFYTVDQRPWVQREREHKGNGHEGLFDKRHDCLNCHGRGTLVRSVYPAADGVPLTLLGDHNTDHRTPIEELWGGWYVTGTVTVGLHRGNSVVTDPRATPETVKFTAIADRFDPAGYLTPYSDIAALMVFEHQMHMMNLLTAARVSDNARELVDYLLFVDEPALRGSVEGTSGFAERFAAAGVRDRRGRSLRELDLTKRLMRYPCSYMIYTEAFEGLPALRKDAIYRRMWRVLSGEEKDPKYAGLNLADRRAIAEILSDTKKGLPDYWKAAAI